MSCTCAYTAVTKYQKRVSGPLLDKLDIHIEVPQVDYDKLTSDLIGELSTAIRSRVESARQIPRQRFVSIKSRKDSSPQVACNADMRVAEVSQFCKLDETGESLVIAAMSQMSLSARGYHRVLKLARTVADLAGSEQIQTPHVAEALQCRSREMVGYQRVTR